MISLGFTWRSGSFYISISPLDTSNSVLNFGFIALFSPFHISVVWVAKSIFDEVAGEDTFSCIGIDIDEPADDGIGDDHQDHILPPEEAVDSLVDVDGAQDVHQGCQEDWSQEFVVFHRVEESHKVVFSKSASLVALSASITERSACQVDVGVGISSDITEETSTTAFVASLAKFVTASSWMTGEKLNEEHG